MFVIILSGYQHSIYWSEYFIIHSLSVYRWIFLISEIKEDRKFIYKSLTKILGF